jgi:hypothetical protein
VPNSVAATIPAATPASGLSATAVVFAPPELVKPSDQQEEVKDDTAQKDSAWRKKEGWGKKVKPPSMILDEDINGFKAQHKRRAGGGGRKGKKVYLPSWRLVSSLIRHMQNKNAQIVAVWDPMEPYDTLKPNDYNEYKMWKQRDRVERASERAAERKRARDAIERGSDHTGSDSEDERPKKSGVQTTPKYAARLNFWFQGGLTTSLSISGLVRMMNALVGLAPPTLPQFRSIVICQEKRPFRGGSLCPLLLLDYRHLHLPLWTTCRVRKPTSAALPCPREVSVRPHSLRPLPLSVDIHRAPQMTRTTSLDCRQSPNHLFPRFMSKQGKKRICVAWQCHRNSVLLLLLLNHQTNLLLFRRSLPNQ